MNGDPNLCDVKGVTPFMYHITLFAIYLKPCLIENNV